MTIFLILGLFTGIFVNMLRFFDISNPFYYCTTLIFLLSYGFCYNEKKNLRLLLSSVLVAIVLASPLISLTSWTLHTTAKSFYESERMLTFLISFPVLVYVGHSFHYAYHHDNTLHWRYATLFSAVWNSFVLLITAILFLGIAKLLIILAALLFKTVGNDILWNAYFKNAYIYTSIDWMLFFIGLGIAQQNYQIIHNLRFLLLRMMHFLLPLLAIISITYLLLYLVAFFQSGSPDWLSIEILLTTLMILGVVFFNADFQTGEEDSSWSSRLTVVINCYRWALLCISLLLVYRVLIKYTPPVNMMIYLLIGVLYCLLYSFTVFLSKEKQKNWITSGNQCIALFFLAIMLILNHPTLPSN